MPEPTPARGQRPQGGRRRTLTLYATAKAIGLEPRTYFRDVILRMAVAAPHEREALAEDLTPHRWRELFADQVRDHQLAILERLLEQWRGTGPA